MVRRFGSTYRLLSRDLGPLDSGHSSQRRFGLGVLLVIAPSLLDNLLTAFVLVILAVVATIGLVVIDRHRRRGVP